MGIKPAHIWVDANEIYADQPSSSSPYKHGALKESYMQDSLNMINFYRFLAGVPAVTLDDTYTNYAQHGAVVMDAVKEMTHYPTQPSDMDDDFFALGYRGTSSSNIAWNTSYTSAQTVKSLMDDTTGDNPTKVGHRRWFLNPDMQKTGIGQSGTYHDMYILDGDRKYTGIDYTAFPSGPAFPIDLFSPSVGWSVQLSSNIYKQPETQDAKITLRHVNSGQTWEFYDGCSEFY